MTPKEKAKELFKKHLLQVGTNCEHDSYCDNEKCQYEKSTICCVDLFKSKKCALISVDEILTMLVGSPCTINYWSDVKKEIEKL